MNTIHSNSEEAQSARNDSDKVAIAIKGIVTEMMDKVVDKVLYKDPFVPEKHHASKPLYAALVPDEIFKGAHFERRFVTPFGKVWEQLADVVAQAHHGHCSLGKLVSGSIKEGRLRRIQETLNRLEHASSKTQGTAPDWKKEMDYILAGDGVPIPATVVCDLYVDSQFDQKRYAFELKGPSRTATRPR